MECVQNMRLYVCIYGRRFCNDGCATHIKADLLIKGNMKICNEGHFEMYHVELITWNRSSGIDHVEETEWNRSKGIYHLEETEWSKSHGYIKWNRSRGRDRVE